MKNIFAIQIVHHSIVPKVERKAENRAQDDMFHSKCFYNQPEKANLTEKLQSTILQYPCLDTSIHRFHRSHDREVNIQFDEDVFVFNNGEKNT